MPSAPNKIPSNPETSFFSFCSFVNSDGSTAGAGWGATGAAASAGGGVCGSDVSGVIGSDGSGVGVSSDMVVVDYEISR